MADITYLNISKANDKPYQIQEAKKKASRQNNSNKSELTIYTSNDTEYFATSLIFESFQRNHTV